MDLAQLYRTLERQQALIHQHFDALLNLNTLEDAEGIIPCPVTLRQCDGEAVSALGVDFREPVLLEGCQFQRVNFYGSYFLKGLSIRNCRFSRRVDFENGGHNPPECPVLIEDTVFEGFVNFLDCCFEGPLIIRNCRFEAGTNLLGLKGLPGSVRFEVPPVLDNVQGELSIHHRVF